MKAITLVELLSTDQLTDLAEPIALTIEPNEADFVTSLLDLHASTLQEAKDRVLSARQQAYHVAVDKFVALEDKSDAVMPSEEDKFLIYRWYLPHDVDTNELITGGFEDRTHVRYEAHDYVHGGPSTPIGMVVDGESVLAFNHTLDTDVLQNLLEYGTSMYIEEGSGFIELIPLVRRRADASWLEPILSVILQGNIGGLLVRNEEGDRTIAISGEDAMVDVTHVDPVVTDANPAMSKIK